MDNTDLLLCPFCGGKGMFLHIGDNVYYVRCQECGATTNTAAGKSGAAKRWNKRFKPTCDTCEHNKDEICEVDGFLIVGKNYACAEYDKRGANNGKT